VGVTLGKIARIRNKVYMVKSTPETRNTQATTIPQEGRRSAMRSFYGNAAKSIALRNKAGKKKNGGKTLIARNLIIGTRGKGARGEKGKRAKKGNTASPLFGVFFGWVGCCFFLFLGEERGVPKQSLEKRGPRSNRGDSSTKKNSAGNKVRDRGKRGEKKKKKKNAGTEVINHRSQTRRNCRTQQLEPKRGNESKRGRENKKRSTPILEKKNVPPATEKKIEGDVWPNGKNTRKTRGQNGKDPKRKIIRRNNGKPQGLRRQDGQIFWCSGRGPSIRPGVWTKSLQKEKKKKLGKKTEKRGNGFFP